MTLEESIPDYEEPRDEKVYTGRNLEGHEIGDKLGEGGFGVVYIGEKDGKKFALKVLRQNNPRLSSTLRREFKAQEKLSHDNIREIKEFCPSACFDDNGNEPLALLVMEYVAGSHLDVTKTDADNFYSIAVQTTEALQAAHDAGIIHKDLKPTNILITNEGKVKVTDFGLAKIVQEHSVLEQSLPVTSAPHERSITGPGTYGHFPPGEEPDSPAYDLYSLGVAFFQMIIGRKEYPDPDVYDDVKKAAEEKKLVKPEAIAELVKNLVSKKVNRCANIAEMKQMEGYRAIDDAENRFWKKVSTFLKEQIKYCDEPAENQEELVENMESYLKVPRSQRLNAVKNVLSRFSPKDREFLAKQIAYPDFYTSLDSDELLRLSLTLFSFEELVKISDLTDPEQYQKMWDRFNKASELSTELGFEDYFEQQEMALWAKHQDKFDQAKAAEKERKDAETRKLKRKRLEKEESAGRYYEYAKLIKEADPKKLAKHRDEIIALAYREGLDIAFKVDEHRHKSLLERILSRNEPMSVELDARKEAEKYFTDSKGLPDDKTLKKIKKIGRKKGVLVHDLVRKAVRHKVRLSAFGGTNSTFEEMLGLAEKQDVYIGDIIEDVVQVRTRKIVNLLRNSKDPLRQAVPFHELFYLARSYNSSFVLDSLIEVTKMQHINQSNFSYLFQDKDSFKKYPARKFWNNYPKAMTLVEERKKQLMEKIKKESLEERVKKPGKLSKALAVTRQMASGISTAVTESLIFKWYKALADIVLIEPVCEIAQYMKNKISKKSLEKKSRKKTSSSLLGRLKSRFVDTDDSIDLENLQEKYKSSVKSGLSFKQARKMLDKIAKYRRYDIDFYNKDLGDLVRLQVNEILFGGSEMPHNVFMPQIAGKYIHDAKQFAKRYNTDITDVIQKLVKTKAKNKIKQCLPDPLPPYSTHFEYYEQLEELLAFAERNKTDIKQIVDEELRKKAKKFVQNAGTPWRPESIADLQQLANLNELYGGFDEELEKAMIFFKKSYVDGSPNPPSEISEIEKQIKEGRKGILADKYPVAMGLEQNLEEKVKTPGSWLRSFSYGGIPLGMAAGLATTVAKFTADPDFLQYWPAAFSTIFGVLAGTAVHRGYTAIREHIKPTESLKKKTSLLSRIKSYFLRDIVTDFDGISAASYIIGLPIMGGVISTAIAAKMYDLPTAGTAGAIGMGLGLTYNAARILKPIILPAKTKNKETLTDKVDEAEQKEEPIAEEPVQKSYQTVDITGVFEKIKERTGLSMKYINEINADKSKFLNFVKIGDVENAIEEVLELDELYRQNKAPKPQVKEPADFVEIDVKEDQKPPSEEKPSPQVSYEPGPLPAQLRKKPVEPPAEDQNSSQEEDPQEEPMTE